MEDTQHLREQNQQKQKQEFFNKVGQPKAESEAIDDQVPRFSALSVH